LLAVAGITLLKKQNGLGAEIRDGGVLGGEEDRGRVQKSGRRRRETADPEDSERASERSLEQQQQRPARGKKRRPRGRWRGGAAGEGGRQAMEQKLKGRAATVATTCGH